MTDTKEQHVLFISTQSHDRRIAFCSRNGDEIMRFYEDGVCFIKGEKMDDSPTIYATFRDWLERELSAGFAADGDAFWFKAKNGERLVDFRHDGRCYIRGELVDDNKKIYAEMMAFFQEHGMWCPRVHIGGEDFNIKIVVGAAVEVRQDGTMWAEVERV